MGPTPASDTEPMTIPETDLARTRRFCGQQVPIELRAELRVEYRVRGRTMTLVEHRPPWNRALDQGWTDVRS